MGVSARECVYPGVCTPCLSLSLSLFPLSTHPEQGADALLLHDLGRAVDDALVPAGRALGHEPRFQDVQGRGHHARDRARRRACVRVGVSGGGRAGE